MQDDALTADDVAVLLRVSRNTVYNLVKRDQLASYHVGRKMRFTKADVENYIARSASSHPGAGAPASSARAQRPVDVPSAPVPGSAAAPAVQGAGGIGPQRGAEGYAIAGNDMIGDVLANYLGSLGHAVERRYEDSYAALVHLYLGDVDAALVHLLDAATGTYNVEYVRRLVPAAPVRLASLVARQQGFIVAKGNPKRIFSWRDLLRDDVRLINRELGSGSRVLLDVELGRLDEAAGATPARPVVPARQPASTRVRGYDDVASSALSMASYVERGAADVGVGAERVARQVGGVDFVPLQRERLDVALSMRPTAREASEAVLRLLRTRAVREEIAALTGCDASRAGTILL